MEELINLGISENTLKCMLEINPNLKNISNNEIIEKEKILSFIGCSQREILSIISSNALYLDRSNEEVMELLNYFKHIGFSNIDKLIDANPNILNLVVSEIENYIDKRKINGEIFEDIIDDLESNTYLFDEI